jgi:hypothetical protein
METSVPEPLAWFNGVPDGRSRDEWGFFLVGILAASFLVVTCLNISAGLFTMYAREREP